jgi:hypothetical protein
MDLAKIPFRSCADRALMYFHNDNYFVFLRLNTFSKPKAA